MTAVSAVLVLSRVEAAETSAPPFTAPDEIEFRTETVWSEGVRLVAEVFSQEQEVDARLPTIVMCHGWGEKRNIYVLMRFISRVEAIW